MSLNLDCEISAIRGRFPLIIFCIWHAESPPYFRYVWPTDLESLLHASSREDNSFHEDEVDTTLHCWVIAFCCRYVTWLCDLDLCPFNIELWSCMAGHVVNFPPNMKMLSISALLSAEPVCRNHLLVRGPDAPPQEMALWGSNTWACPDLPTVDILNLFKRRHQRCGLGLWLRLL